MPSQSIKNFYELRACHKRAEMRKAKRKIKRKTLFHGKPRLLKRSELVLRNDEAAKAYVKIRDKRRWGGRCPFGLHGFVESCARERRMIEVWFHFIKRSRSEKLRWDVDRNIVGSCAPCNGYMENNSAPFWAWYINQFSSDGMIKLEQDSHGPSGFGRIELDAIYKNIQGRLSSVCTEKY